MNLLSAERLRITPRALRLYTNLVPVGTGWQSLPVLSFTQMYCLQRQYDESSSPFPAPLFLFLYIGVPLVETRKNAFPCNIHRHTYTHTHTHTQTHYTHTHILSLIYLPYIVFCCRFTWIISFLMLKLLPSTSTSVSLTIR